MRLWTTLLLVAILAWPAGAQDANAPYQLTVWADATFDAEGGITRLEFPQQDQYPGAFLENVAARIAARPPQPRQYEGQPASFQTGVRVTVTITPAGGGGSVSVDGIEEVPRVTRMAKFVLREKDPFVPSDAGGVLRVRCAVSIKGRCQRVDFEAAGADVPASTREQLLRAMAGWRFEPQRFNGKPVAGSIVVPVEVEVLDVVKPVLKTN